MKKFWVIAVGIALSCCLNKTVEGAAGDLDPLFGSGGVVTTDIASSSDSGGIVALQPDGKIIVAGSAQNLSNGQLSVALVRYNPNGSLDPTFGSGGIVVTTINTFANDVVLQGDGKIVVSAGGLIARFNPNGSVDPTFGSGGTINLLASSLAIQSDGKILAAVIAGGDFTVARLNPNGSLDATFGNGGQVSTDLGGNDTAKAIGLQSDSKIVASGMSGDAAGVVRYNPNGSLDPTFGSGGIVLTFVAGGNFSRMTIQQDDKILIAGDVQDEAIILGGDSDFAMLRYNPNGSPDPTFGFGGLVITDVGNNNEHLNDVTVQPNGKIVLVGSIIAASFDFAVLRYNPNGSLEGAFGSGGIVITDLGGENDFPSSVVVQPDGFIVVAGSSSINDDDFLVTRYEGDLIINQCDRFTDVFEDGILATDWTYVKPAWNEANGNLIGTPTGGKAEAIATPAFAGCSTAPCTMQTSMQTSGGLSNKLFFFGWFQDKQNTLEVLMKEENEKWVLRQRSGGVVVAKTKVSRLILPNVPYDVKVDFDGTTFTLSIDNVNSASMTAGAVPSGTVGYRVKKTTGRFGFVCVN